MDTLLSDRRGSVATALGRSLFDMTRHFAARPVGQRAMARMSNSQRSHIKRIDIVVSTRGMTVD